MHGQGFLAGWIVALFLVAVAGCGEERDESADKEDAMRAAQAYVDALAAKDSTAACEYVPQSEDLCIRETEEEFKAGPSIGEDFGAINKVCLSGDAAVAYETGGGFLVLSRTGDGWKIGAPAEETSDCPTGT